MVGSVVSILGGVGGLLAWGLKRRGGQTPAAGGGPSVVVKDQARVKTINSVQGVQVNNGRS